MGAQPAPAAGVANIVRYPAADFAPYAPQTALDMVRRTPGVVLDEGDEDIRGYGAAGGNVLIDGVRPASKAGVIDALSRISASQVERIDVILNASTAEAQGQALVINVIRTERTASGTWSAEIERNGNGRVYPRLEASYARTVGSWETSMRFSGLWEEFPFRTLRLVRGASGDLLSSVETDLPSTLAMNYVSGDARRPLAGGMLNLTGRFGRYHYYYDQPGDTYLGRLPDGDPDITQVTSYDEGRWDLELGADYTRDLGAWRWKTLGLLTAKDGVESQSDPRRDREGTLLSDTTVDATARPLELVARTTFARVDATGWKPEVGVEVAYNRLDSTFALWFDDGTGPIPIALPGADVLVEELRGEAFAKVNRSWTPRLGVEMELAVETSEISISGDVEQTQSFVFFKSAVALSWRPGDRSQWRLGMRRRVSQLDFGDFAASASLNDGTTVAGNPDLGPDQATRYYASVDYRGSGDLALNVEAFHEDRQDVLEQVLLPSGAVGLANAGDATYRGVKASLTLPLDAVLAAARLTIDATVLRSSFDDPIIETARPLSRVYSPLVNAEFRHDLSARRFSWGVTWKAANEGAIYRVAEIDRLRVADNFGAFIESGALGDFKLRLAARNADTLRNHRSRQFFRGDRSAESVQTEERRQRSPMFLTLTLSGNF
ncbi:TonB-dependent receptor domain-containing protein [Luteimonas saliphila]|uniref:TonB-dependent receptor domain-containing protein n=1 Tax=Luteimonas saliphila TaxID=2804919 RepID=UPI00192D55CF